MTLLTWRCLLNGYEHMSESQEPSLGLAQRWLVYEAQCLRIRGRRDLLYITQELFQYLVTLYNRKESEKGCVCVCVCVCKHIYI